MRSQPIVLMLRLFCSVVVVFVVVVDVGVVGVVFVVVVVPDTGSDTRFDSSLVNILVKNNLVNNLVVHSC